MYAPGRGGEKIVKFAYLGSGSRGNSALVEAGTTCIMLDCGFSVRQTQQRLARLGRSPSDIDALLVTHEHSDHASGVGAMARRHGIRVFMTPGTYAGCRDQDIPTLSMLNCHAPLEIGDIRIAPVPVPHDAREPCQFVFESSGLRLGVLTDAGHVTRHMLDAYQGCDTLMLECNHDLEMLARGPYPPALRQRVGGKLGHLNNTQAARMVADLRGSGLGRVLAAHVSEKNNTHALARGALAESIECEPDEIDVIAQDAGIPWQAVAASQIA